MENPMSTQLTRSFSLALGMALVSVFHVAQSRADHSPESRADRPTLSGNWAASPLRSDWNIGEWGASCGPRPGGGAEAGGAVRVTATGNELLFNFPARRYSTSECWEQYPGLVRNSHTSGARAWRNICKTSPSDPRQASVVTTISATDSSISFDETGQYQFLIQGQNCTASVRRTRSLTLVQREGEAPPPKPSAAASAAKPAQRTPRAANCAANGLPERLEVRPSRKLMRPGETFTFRAVVLDSAGCALPIAPTWETLGRTSSIQLSGQGKVTVADDAPEGEVRLSASVADRSVPLSVEIVSKDRYDALLKQRELNAEGESVEAAVAKVTSSTIGATGGVVVQPKEPQGKRIAFVAVIGGLSLALGLLGLFVIRRSRRAPTPEPGAATSFPPPAAAGRQVAIKICPTCRDEYPEEAVFCASDGNRLVPLSSAAPVGPTGGVCPICAQGYDPGVSVCPKHGEPLIPALVQAELRRTTAIIQRICPVCGTQFPGDSQFCGKCGAALVPVN